MSDPITKSKSTVSPYIKTHKTPPITIDPPTETAMPITKAVNGNIVLAPQPSTISADIAAIDKRVDGLINYLEQWIKVGNLNMSNIKEYIEKFIIFYFY